MADDAPARPAMPLSGSRVLVIGGSSGIGHGVAVLARQAGAETVIASSSPAKVQAAVGRLPGATGGVVDLRDQASIAALFDKVGRFDHLAITAGDWTGGLFAPKRDIDLVAARDGLEVRFWGALAAVQQGSRTIAPDGSITLTSGMLAHRPGRGAVLATAVGGAVEHLAYGLAIDLAPVRVNVVCPGLTLTDPVRQMSEETRQAYVRTLPLPRCATPAEAALAYLHLMQNGYVTGQVMRVDGGSSLV